MKIPTTEKRFREGSGVQYLQSGAVRCQALGKNQLRKWRKEHDDYDIPNEELWPECQCTRAAEPGAFACKWHGGLTPSKSKPRSVLDVLPIDFREKFEVLSRNPDYISRKEDILLMKARQWELLDSLQETVGGEEAWGMVADALNYLNKGDEINAIALLEQALSHQEHKKDTWNELYRMEGVVKDLTNTEMRTAKELRLMATFDQVTYLIQDIQGIIQEAGNKFIDEPTDRSDFLRFIGNGIGKLINVSPTLVVESTSSASGEDN